MTVPGMAEDVAILLELIIIDEVILLELIIIDEVILLELIIIDEVIILLVEVIIVDIGGIAPAVTVTVTVHEADDTAFMTGAINMHVDSGIADEAIFEEDIIVCALASDAAARAAIIWVILTILAECRFKMLCGNRWFAKEWHSQNA